MWKRIALAVIAAVFVSGLLVGCASSEPSGTQDVIGIIGAMDSEVDSLKGAMEIENTTTVAQMEFCEGTLGNRRVVVVKCGVGKVNAGMCANTLINQFGCTEVVNTGVAGSLDNRIDIGDIVVSVDAVQHDYDCSPIGYKRGEILYTGLVAFPADEGLRSAAVDAVREAASDVEVFEGRVCTGDQFVSTSEQKVAITSEFDGLCCEMEGAAIAQACYLNETPFVIIRAISDKTDGSQEVEYETFQAEAAKHCADVVQYMVEHGL